MRRRSRRSVSEADQTEETICAVETAVVGVRGKKKRRSTHLKGPGDKEVCA